MSVTNIKMTCKRICCSPAKTTGEQIFKVLDETTTLCLERLRAPIEGELSVDVHVLCTVV